MATRRPSSVAPGPKPRPELKVSQDDARTRLVERIAKGRDLKTRSIESAEDFETLNGDYKKWDSFNVELLSRMFTTDEFSEEYSHWGVMMARFHEPSIREKLQELNENVDKKCLRLDSIVERLELIPVSGTVASVSASHPIEPATPSAFSNQAFIVHGRDELAKTSLEAFLHEIGLEPIVLHRKADQGDTVIEKIERYGNVGYAFILLTPDEVAYLAHEDSLPDADRRKERRSRPNVMFEFGYFVGKIGRRRVCCVLTGNVKVPSDLKGLIYKPYVNNLDEVKYSITVDLKAAGYKLK